MKWLSNLSRRIKPLFQKTEDKRRVWATTTKKWIRDIYANIYGKIETEIDKARNRKLKDWLILLVLWFLGKYCGNWIFVHVVALFKNLF